MYIKSIPFVLTGDSNDIRDRHTASIVQGSGIGPYLFIIYAMGLKCVSSYNTILKYADETILLVPQKSPVSLEEEFAHIIDWSFNNKLTINTSKTKETVFRRSRFPNKLLPPLLPDIQRVDFIKLLVIYLSHTLFPDQHINHLLSQCNQRLYFVLVLNDELTF